MRMIRIVIERESAHADNPIRTTNANVLRNRTILFYTKRNERNAL